MSAINTLRDRWDWVDSAKGIGIMLVVYGHVARGLYNAGIYTDQASFALIDSIIYSFHMPLFFFLSGLFCISSFEKRGAKLAFNKIDAIYYPYLLWSLIQGSIEIGMGGLTNHQVSWDALLNVVWQPRAQFWFLYTLFFVFLLNISLLWILQRTLSSKKEWWPHILTLVAALLFMCISYLPGLFLFQSVAQYDLYFALGVLSWSYLRSGKKIGINYLLILVVVFAATQYAAISFEVITNRQSLSAILLACVGIALVIGIAMRGTLFAFIGRYSMEIFLMHVIFGSGIRVLMQKGWAIDAVLPHLLIGSVLGMLLPILATKVIHRMKFEFLLKPPMMLRLGNR